MFDFFSESESLSQRPSNVTAECLFALFATQRQELRGRLDAAVEQADALRERLQGTNAENRKLERKVQEVAKESQEARRVLEEELRDSSSRSRRSLELVSWYVAFCLREASVANVF